jgi:hypothetical protein
MLRAGIAAAASSAFVIGVTALPANAAQDVQQDGLVNVNVGDVAIANGVNVAVVANVIANVCDAVDVGPIAAGVLGRARATDNSGRDMTVCTADGQPVTVTQN